MPYLGGNLGSFFIQQSNDFMALGFPVFFHSRSLTKSYAVRREPDPGYVAKKPSPIETEFALSRKHRFEELRRSLGQPIGVGESNGLLPIDGPHQPLLQKSTVYKTPRTAHPGAERLLPRRSFIRTDVLISAQRQNPGHPSASPRPTPRPGLRCLCRRGSPPPGSAGAAELGRVSAPPLRGIAISGP